ncbi:hypothetical protein [Exiguobacterium sp. s191]|uniref:hypothetical protein n=1 Tax=Exiguobacterium sp. s191 TaxID=2751196 RepID=UPI001BE92C77|nr:hypothetical protein [Exiguobacterium sp. s191]
MSSKEVWSVEGYEKADNNLDLEYAFTNEAEARESAKEMAGLYDNLAVYVKYTKTVNGGIIEESHFNSNGTYDDEGEPW